MGPIPVESGRRFFGVTQYELKASEAALNQCLLCGETDVEHRDVEGKCQRLGDAGLSARQATLSNLSILQMGLPPGFTTLVKNIERNLHGIAPVAHWYSDLLATAGRF